MAAFVGAVAVHVVCAFEPKPTPSSPQVVWNTSYPAGAVATHVRGLPTSPVLGGSVVFVTWYAGPSQAGQLCALNASNGNVLWHTGNFFQLGQNIAFIAASATGDVIYVAVGVMDEQYGSRCGYTGLAAVEAATGKLKWHVGLSLYCLLWIKPSHDGGVSWKFPYSLLHISELWWQIPLNLPPAFLFFC